MNFFIFSAYAAYVKDGFLRAKKEVRPMPHLSICHNSLITKLSLFGLLYPVFHKIYARNWLYTAFCGYNIFFVNVSCEIVTKNISANNNTYTGDQHRVVFAVFCVKRKIELPLGQFEQKQCKQRAFACAAKRRMRKPLR